MWVIEYQSQNWYSGDMEVKEKFKQDVIGVFLALGVIVTIIAIFGGF